MNNGNLATPYGDIDDYDDGQIHDNECYYIDDDDDGHNDNDDDDDGDVSESNVMALKQFDCIFS